MIPEHAHYRKVVEQFTTERLNAVKQHEQVRVPVASMGRA